MNSHDSPWLPYHRPRPSARLVLYCFHHAGGSATVFRDWLQFLPQEIELCAIQLPGREGRLREPPFTAVDPLVESLIGELWAGEIERPFALFGHSLGGRLAFEVTSTLRRRGRRLPAHLFVSGCRAPMLGRDEPLHRLPDAELIAELGRYAGTPPEVLANRELMELLLPTIRADFELIETMPDRREAPLPVPITAFGGADDVDVMAADLDGWRVHTASVFAQFVFAGDHFFVTSARARVIERVVLELMPYLGG